MEKRKAPAGKVLKGYMFDDGPFSGPLIRHVLLDEYGLVFIPGHGWGSYQHNYRFRWLPTPVEKGNEFHNREWSWPEWWRKNWQCDSWAWCYGRKTEGFISYYRTSAGFCFAA